MDQLMQARAEIDRIDAELARLFEARMQAVEGVIAYKQATGMPVLDAGREEQVIEKNTARIERAELRDYYAQWQKDLMALSRQYQSRVLGRDRVVTARMGKLSHKTAFLSVDGGKAVKLSGGDSVEIRRSRDYTRLVRLTDRSFYDIVGQKLGKG